MPDKNTGTGHVWRNPLSGRQVLFAPGRAKRPVAADGDPADCPFCPGHEHLLPAVLCEHGASDGRPWATRAVPNKYPLVQGAAGQVERDRLAHGRHEVIVETPHHGRDLTLLSRAEMRDVVAMYCHRFAVLSRDHQAVVLFRNHGPQAGASQVHAHAQIVAFDGIPDEVEATAIRDRNYYDRHGDCVICSIIAAEASAGDRMVTTGGPFVAFVPMVAEAPFDIWIASRTHADGFGAMAKDDRDWFAAVLQDVLGRLCRALDDPDYCFGVAGIAHQAADRHLHHWVMRVRPVLTTPGGLELVTGMSVNPSTPEEDAAALRAAGSIQ